MRKQKEHMNLATEIIYGMKKQLIICRIALAVSVVCNFILAAVLIVG